MTRVISPKKIDYCVCFNEILDLGSEYRNELIDFFSLAIRLKQLRFLFWCLSHLNQVKKI